MVTLFCAVVGTAGSAFPVDIDASQSVGHLEEAITTTQKYDFAASTLQLYLAKKDTAKRRPAALRPEKGEIHDDTQSMIDGEQMKATWSMQDWLDDKEMLVPLRRQIHVLVVVATEEIAAQGLKKAENGSRRSPSVE
ncbi:TPA: hypothetical protein N0F65_002947 [Lagenidium giganteum]|uniref:Crinkler effector protein N-terminal domain-containing protein n=1 Tax=Lagenidium giganteum TaxID=4803 RepID=A0AAV2Z6B3_9STRA|nr:TPA: hypothetical protein N0F65_002947 [Lagenidium giganteum]